MAFSSKVRIDALVAAARHCCVCHRYKGVRVEVHHIVPVSKGGTDDPENAICLCFDCHADAGHYNPEHSRGTKFSPQELRSARDNWYLTVLHNQIEAPREDDRFYCRYLVCKSFSALNEIASGDLSSIPCSAPILVKTLAGEFLSEILKHYPQPHRGSHIPGDLFKDRNGYQEAHRDVRIFGRSNINLFPYFEASRVPTHEELRKRVAPQDPLTAVLLQAGIPESEISEAFAYEEVCEGSGCGFREIYRLRPLWGVYLCVTNLDNRPIDPESLIVEIEQPGGVGYRSMLAREKPAAGKIILPRMPIPPEATVVLPIATVLGPIRDIAAVNYRTEYRDVKTGESEEISHSSGEELVHQCALLGPAIWPIALEYDDRGTQYQQEMHEFDLSNLYTISRGWECGCCPHLFLEREDSSLIYEGELWAAALSLVQIREIGIPYGVRALIVAELENEVTHAVRISTASHTVSSNCMLVQGQCLRIAVNPGDLVSLEGYYITGPTSRSHNLDPWRKNQLIVQYMEGFQSRHPDW